ncbi:hypothetical protein [Methyloceanibacter sp.]|uniref:hypothetical protein n=1 Tax=Methyloceanibacter sp. TaxID=1965321 RepID=UPI002D493B54|nr:hypothetical protein [Methyloceanibacter sp.]HZP10028.1 hypothetical protein [Methyloceanibacter sp.]
MLYWIVYHLDLGRLGPKVLDLAVRSWLRRAKNGTTVPAVKRQSFGGATRFHLEPNLGADERM